MSYKYDFVKVKDSTKIRVVELSDSFIGPSNSYNEVLRLAANFLDYVEDTPWHLDEIHFSRGEDCWFSLILIFYRF